MVGEKTCSKCGETFPRTLEHFKRYPRNTDGLSGWCRPCQNAYQRALTAQVRSTPEGRAKTQAANRACYRRHNPAPAAKPDTRTCKCCGLTVLPTQENWAWKNGKPKGLTCRLCARQSRRVKRATKRLTRGPAKPQSSWKTNNRAWMRYLDAKKRAKRATKNGWYAALVQATPSWLTPEMWLVMGGVYEQSYLGEKDLVVDHVIPLVGVDEDGRHVVCGLHVPWNLQIITNRQNAVKGSKTF